MKEKVIVEQNKKLLPGAAMVGLIVAVIIFVVILNAEKNALADFEKGSIYVAAKEIPQGTLITAESYQEYFELKELDADLIPQKAVSSIEQIDGLISGYMIDEDTLLTLGMFERENEITKDMDEPVIAGCKAEDLYQMVGGVLRAGDRVHIYNVDEEGAATLQWSNVYVQQVFDNTGANIEPGNKEASAQRINIYMDKADIEDFYSKLATGTLRVVKVCE